MSTELKTITAPSTPPVSALAVLASKLHCDPSKLLATLTSTVFKGATTEELLSLVVVANVYGLNPLLKELYAFPAKGGGIVPIVSIDGWLRIINDHSQMDGIRTTVEDGPDGLPISCTCEIYRKDRSYPTVATEYYSECRRNTEPWKMAHRMLRHKAIIQCARIAFGFSGIHDEDEGAVIGERPAKGREINTARTVPLDPFAVAPVAILQSTESWDTEPSDEEDFINDNGGAA
jgi:phage recombination protein Bet